MSTAMMKIHGRTTLVSGRWRKINVTVPIRPVGTDPDDIRHAALAVFFRTPIRNRYEFSGCALWASVEHGDIIDKVEFVIDPDDPRWRGASGRRAIR